MRRVGGIAVLAMALLIAAGATGQAKKQEMPYFASIGAGKARMRAGPARTYPATWLYVRADLPVKVIDTFKEWKKIEDPGGTQGWMLGNLISTTRTGIVQGTIVDLRDRPAFGGRVMWRAQPGVVGRISQCADGWCRLDVRGQAGFVEASRLWGVASDETLP